MNKRNIGIFRIDASYFHQENFDLVKSIMNQISAVVKAEYSYNHDAFEYTAISHHFDKIQERSKIPVYEVDMCPIRFMNSPVSFKRFVRTNE